METVKQAVIDHRTPSGVKATYEELLDINRALADLTELVEGLNHLLYANHKPCLGCDGCNKARQALAQLEAHRKEGA